MRRIVIDTNVFIAALRSRQGRSNRLISLVGASRFETVISVPLILEYEDVALRQIESLVYSVGEVQEIIDFICWAGEPRAIYYLWRPFLPDAKDDLVLEVAVAGRCDTIVTFNRRDFRGSEQFGLRLQNPGEFLQELDHESTEPTSS
jgi:putative PIN family toxin of toxin-antitoxin system